MACNGNYHRKNCPCNFRGGHPNTQLPAWRGWGTRAARHYITGPNANCTECNARVYYIPGPKGGGTYFDCIGPPWTKHPCTSQPKPYSPFNKDGHPKLRNRRSQFERDGWLPFIVRNVEQLATGTIVHGVALDNPTVLHFGFPTQVEPERIKPVFFRNLPNDKTLVEFNFFPHDSEIPVSLLGFDDCRNEFDIVLQQKQ